MAEPLLTYIINKIFFPDIDLTLILVYCILTTLRQLSCARYREKQCIYVLLFYLNKILFQLNNLCVFAFSSFVILIETLYNTEKKCENY